MLMDGSRIVTADVLAFTTNAETQAATRMPLPAAWSSAVVAVSGLFTTEHPIAFLQRDGPPHRAECSTTRQHPPGVAGFGRLIMGPARGPNCAAGGVG